jgi:hypothetical protein
MTSTPQPTSVPPDSAAAGRPTWGQVFDERAPILATPAYFGPPVIYVLGPWLLVVLLLIGPFALVLTVLLAAVVAAVLLGIVVAAIASPFLLLRHLRAHRTVDARPRAFSRPFRTHRVSPGRLGSPQPKGMS